MENDFKKFIKGKNDMLWILLLMYLEEFGIVRAITEIIFEYGKSPWDPDAAKCQSIVPLSKTKFIYKSCSIVSLSNYQLIRLSQDYQNKNILEIWDTNKKKKNCIVKRSMIIILCFVIILWRKLSSIIKIEK